MAEHHAYLVIGGKKEGFAHAHTLFPFSSEYMGQNPDVQILEYATVGIDDARLLGRWASQQPVQEEKRLFIIVCEHITHETQNALLKLFEDPPQTSAFIVCIPQKERLIPTLLSRLYTLSNEAVPVDQRLARTFLAQTVGERLEEIVRRTKEKDAVWGNNLLSSLEEVLYDMQEQESLRSILFAHRYLDRRGASHKMLLDHVALSLPHS